MPATCWTTCFSRSRTMLAVLCEMCLDVRVFGGLEVWRSGGHGAAVREVKVLEVLEVRLQSGQGLVYFYTVSFLFLGQQERCAFMHSPPPPNSAKPMEAVSSFPTIHVR